jgi:hypothetical protein
VHIAIRSDQCCQLHPLTTDIADNIAKDREGGDCAQAGLRRVLR